MLRRAACLAVLAGLTLGSRGEALPRTQSSPASHALAPLGPLGHWKGDDGQAPSSAADSSGNGHPGAFSPGATVSETVPPTKFTDPGSFSLDGKTGMVTVPDAPELRMTGDFTVAFWMRRIAQTDDWVRMVGKGGGAPRNFGVWMFPSADGRIKFQMYNNSGGSILEVDSPPEQATKPDTWYHVTCTLSVNAAALFMNGVLAATGWRNGDPANSADPLTFGHAGYHGFFAGQLDDVRLYDRALSMAEIVYLSGGNGPPAAPTGLSVSGTRAKNVTLQWTATATAPPAGTVMHYIIKRSETSGSGYAALASGRVATTFADATAEAGKTYYYVVTAVNVGGESALSNELKVAPQSP